MKTHVITIPLPSTPRKRAPMKKPQPTSGHISTPAPRVKGSKKPVSELEKTLRAAVIKYGNSYKLAKAAGTSADIVSRFARKERTLRLDTAGLLAAALGLEMK